MPKRQQFFEHILDKLELEILCCTFVAITIPAAFPDKGLDQCWNWARAKAQGLLNALKSTQNVVAFLVAQNSLEIIKFELAILQADTMLRFRHGSCSVCIKLKERHPLS